MSSISGAGTADGQNKDVEADVTSRTEDARADEQADSDDELPPRNAWDDFEEEDVTGSQDETDQPLHAEVNDQADTAASGIAIRLRDSLALESPSTPLGGIGSASPLDSGSIPDDTPSLRLSVASSPGRGASPIPRRTPSRSASGALQPFERRFEARWSVSPSSSPRAASPAFLGSHSRQISLSSQLSHISSQGNTTTTDDGQPDAPWDVIRWTTLRKITSQAFSEVGKRNFGRPTCLAVSALIAVGTSKGLVLGFDYHQTLKIIIGQGTTATECGSVTSVAISADYSTIAAGHANGHIFTWEISRPARPFLRIPPLDMNALRHVQHADGHVSGNAVLHIGFLATRHTALVSADAGGMAFSHLATRGLGPVARTIKTSRLLGRYPSLKPSEQRPRKPSSVLAFAPLPLGNVEQATDNMGLTAMLTPYLLVIVSTTPIAQTQHKSPRPREVQPHSTLSGCLAWFPAVKLKTPSPEATKPTSDAKLVYCWSNVLSVMEIRAVVTEDANKPADLVFKARGRWQAEEAIIAVQWLSRSVLGVLTISQRFLIIEDGSLHLTDTIDLLHKHIYHQDMFSQQLQSVVERLDDEDQALHGVVADAFYMSFKAYKGRTFLLGFDDLTVGTLSNWADRLMSLMEAGDHIAALHLASEYYTGGRTNVTVGLPDADSARQPLVKERLLAMIYASLQYSFAQHNDERRERLKELAIACFEACIRMNEMDYLFDTVYEFFDDADEIPIFVTTMETYLLSGEIASLPPDVVKSAVSYYISENEAVKLEEMLCKLDPRSFDLDQITILCRQHNLYNALIYAWTRAIGDFVTPLVDLLALVRILDVRDDVAENPFFESAMKVYPYLAYTLTGRRYPSGDYMEDLEAYKAKGDVYGYIFAGKPSAWPPKSNQIFRTMSDPCQEPAFPYLVLLLEFNAASLLSMLNEAFEDSFLNEADEDHGLEGVELVNSSANQHGYKMTREHIISIMIDVMRQHDFDPEQIAYIYMFIARAVPKYPGQLVLPGSLLNTTLQFLCEPPSELLRDDCQLSVEYLLSVYRPPNMNDLVESVRRARFYRVLKSLYRSEKMYTEFLSVYFEDPEDRGQVFEAIVSSLQATENQLRIHEAVKATIKTHIHDLAQIDLVATAEMLASRVPELLPDVIEAVAETYQQFLFLRTLLEPTLLPSNLHHDDLSIPPLKETDMFNEQYVRLMCRHDPEHVSDFVQSLPSGDLQIDHVLPAMEESGVVDAAVVLLARDGSARAAMDRLVTHIQSLQHALTNLIESASESPEAALTREAAGDLVASLDKYTKVGIWLCQGQSRVVERRARPRTNIMWEIPEDDLDIDEFLWLNLVDVIVQVAKGTASALREVPAQEFEGDAQELDLTPCATSVRGLVQQVFTALLAATMTPNLPGEHAQVEMSAGTSRHQRNNLSFLRVLRAFLSRAAVTAPSVADLREVLTDIFAAYTFEQEILSLAHELLDSDVFDDVEALHSLRQRGWRPRSQVCEHCKRRAWGQGIGEAIWDAWFAREQQRGLEQSRKLVERGGGVEARRLERGKSKAIVTKTGETTGDEDEGSRTTLAVESRRFELVVFACRHVYHRVCLDADYRDGKPPATATYECPTCHDRASRRHHLE